MVLVRMSQHQIVQLRHILFQQITPQIFPLRNIPAVDHHGIFPAEDQGGIPMTHIQKVHLQHSLRILCFDDLRLRGRHRLLFDFFSQILFPEKK